jgi:hypothetical protein
MAYSLQHIKPVLPKGYIILDMSDDFTCSFPEFVPFCTDLYYFSSYKRFSSSLPGMNF